MPLRPALARPHRAGTAGRAAWLLPCPRLDHHSPNDPHDPPTHHLPPCLPGRLEHSCRYEEDVRLTKEAGCNAFRLSIEWSRIEPRQGEIDMDAVQRCVLCMLCGAVLRDSASYVP